MTTTTISFSFDSSDDTALFGALASLYDAVDAQACEAGNRRSVINSLLQGRPECATPEEREALTKFNVLSALRAAIYSTLEAKA